MIICITMNVSILIIKKDTYIILFLNGITLFLNGIEWDRMGFTHIRAQEQSCQFGFQKG